MTRRQRLTALFGAALLLAGAAGGYAISQSISAAMATDARVVTIEARVVVQKHPGGAVEVALEYGGERYLPRGRFVSRDAETGRWLRSSAVTIEVDAPVPEPVERIVEVEVERIVEVEVEVEKIVEVEVEPPVVPLAVRPSDNEEAGLSCLEEEDEEGNTWTWTDEEEVSTSSSTAFGVYSAGAWSGWATALVVESENFRVEDWQALQKLAAWHVQCAQYHGVDILLTSEYATEPDDWSKLGE